jgi:hypothetical protein
MMKIKFFRQNSFVKTIVQKYLVVKEIIKALTGEKRKNLYCRSY